MDKETNAIPQELFKMAEAIVIFSDQESGIMVKAKTGKGILLCKRHNGEWSNPVEFDLSSTDWLNWFVGANPKDVIMFIGDHHQLSLILKDGYHQSGNDGDENMGTIKATTATFFNGRLQKVNDASWWFLHCPEAENTEFYGADATPEKIVLGEVPFPEDKPTKLGAVHEKLKRLTAYGD